MTLVMDKSFQGLVLSLIVHAILVLLYMHAPAIDMSRNEPTEITLIDKRPPSADRAHIREPDPQQKPEEIFDKLKKQADYLSKYTKRVKKETVASRIDKTVNAMPTPDVLKPQSQGQQKHAGQNQEEGQGSRAHVGGQGGLGGHAQVRTQAIGISANENYIPGVEMGAFTALNTDQDMFYAFYERMNEQVRNRWVSQVRNYVSSLTAKQLEGLSRMDRQSVIEIILRADGEFESFHIFNSSGDQTLDQIGGEAFKDAAPFNNPPRGMVEPDHKIRLRYGFMVVFRPPSMGGSM
jgi:hypothetical protein